MVLRDTNPLSNSTMMEKHDREEPVPAAGQDAGPDAKCQPGPLSARPNADIKKVLHSVLVCIVVGPCPNTTERGQPGSQHRFPARHLVLHSI